MDNEKQIVEEMRKDLIEIFDEEYEKRRIVTADFTAIKMTAKGYRKQSDNVIELPCKEGDTVYVLKTEFTECHLGVEFSEYACQGCEEAECDSVKIFSIRELSNINKWTILDYLWQDRFGRDVFLTKEEAEAKMKGANNE